MALVTEGYEVAPRVCEAFHVGIAGTALHWCHMMYAAGGDATASLTDWMLADY
ncbi:MAG: hypothetical protein SO142_04720 [Prevotella sp.]|nr:hypothetical protein [Prevotella sp.]